jgi:hypothetical protein
MKFEMHGLDAFKKKLEQLEKNADAINGTQVSFAELFDESFMSDHSKFSSLSELVKSGGYSTDAEEFAKIPDEEFDQFIRENTDFSSWEEMKRSAVRKYTIPKLGL